MENEVIIRVSQLKISLIGFFILIFLFGSPLYLFSENLLIKNMTDSSQSLELNDKEDQLYRAEPWRIGVTEILLNIEKPQSDDFLVHEYLKTLILGQLSLFNFHILNDSEKEYIVKQNSDNFESNPYDAELFSRLYKNSLDYLRNQKAEESSAIISSSEVSTLQTLIDSERIPVTFITEGEKNHTLPYVSFDHKIPALVIAKEYQLDSLLSSEIDKIGNVYIFRMYRLSPMIENPVLLLEVSFTKNTLNTISNRTLDALAEGVGGFTRSVLEIETDVSDLKVLIDRKIYSVADLRLKVLPPGDYEIILFSDKNKYHEKKIYTLEPGKITRIEPVIPVPDKIIFSLSIYPFNATIIDESQNRIKNPAEIRISSDYEISLYAEAGGYVSQNLVMENQFIIDSQQTVHLRPEWMDLDSEIAYGQRVFYKSMAAAILSLPASVLLNGLAAEYEFPLYEAALGISLVLNFSLLLDTIISLVDYYKRTEVL